MRIRKKISGTAESPRLAVYRSNKQIYVQVVDDLSGVTILSACSKEKEIAAQTGIKKLFSTEAVINIMAE